MIYTANYASPIGAMTLASDGSSLVGLWIEGQKYFAGTVKDAMVPDEEQPVLVAAKTWLDGYFAGDRPAIAALPLAPSGSVFRRVVWEILCEIPYGECTTYGDIARQVVARLGRPSMSGQAVGGAVGHNPISVIIPCHRVVGTNGSLTGYAGGIEKKIKLLVHEGVDMSCMFVPAVGTAL